MFSGKRFIEGIMVRKKSKYDENDAICVECIEDHGLRDLIKTEGSKRICVLCGNKNMSVTIKELADIIDPYIREHFTHGGYERRYGAGDDDGYWEEQQGEDLSYVIQEILGQSLGCEEALISALIETDPYDPKDGEEAFYDETVNYEETPVYIGDLYEEWNAISNELKAQRRFFSDRAREFFDWLFDEVESLWFYGGEVDFSDAGGKKKPHKSSVIHQWPAGTSVYRSRRADTADDYTRILSFPQTELAPPLSRHARVGRMNPEGVSIFYGALDEPTCLAEMRSSIGGYIVVGRFETSKALHILDFSRLDNTYWDGKQLSYFQPDFEKQIARRKFRRSLHRLISQPVIAGHEHDYLITQVLAEYLAHIRKQNFDGLLFASTQHEGGTNVVLFPKQYGKDDDILSRFSLKYVKDSAGLYRTRKILYDIPRLDFFFVKDEVHIYHDHDDDD
jgi:hypothetical protein